MADDLKALHRRAIDETLNKGNLDFVDQVASPSYVLHDPNQPGDLKGPQQLKDYLGRIRSGFSDISVAIDDQIAEGDKVVTRWTATGTQTGEFNGIPATNKRAQVTGVTIARFEADKVAEEFQLGDFLGLLQQLGVIPSMAPAGASR